MLADYRDNCRRIDFINCNIIDPPAWKVATIRLYEFTPVVMQGGNLDALLHDPARRGGFVFIRPCSVLLSLAPMINRMGMILFCSPAVYPVLIEGHHSFV
jgi:hypothetical protein